jgi:hypothetical protein
MRKALTITLVAAIALFAGSAAYANYCARDVVPASTILVPYAVNAMSGSYTVNSQGQTTILTITNVSRDAQIIHITVWNAESFACLDFNEVLTGYDVWQINFRDMLAGNFGLFDTSQDAAYTANTGTRFPFEWGPDGRSAYQPGTSFLTTPETTTSGNLPTTLCYMPYGNGLDVSSNIDCLRQPLFSRTHAGCGNLNIRHNYDNDWLSSITADWGFNLWYYVTVDVVQYCNLAFPDLLDYFNLFYENENVLIGDIVYLNAMANYSEAINAVHLESDIDENVFNFYGEIANPAGSSRVEPLGTAFAFHYYNRVVDLIQTDVIVWKNFADFIPSGPEVDFVDDCGYYIYYTWDMDEHTTSRAGECRVSPCNPNDIDPNEFPFETQRVPVNQSNFDLPGVTDYESGWMLILFPPTYHEVIGYNDPTPLDTTHPETAGAYNDDQDEWMGWVGVRYTYGTYSAGLEAATMANTHCFLDQVAPQLGVAYTKYVGE